MRRLLLLVGPLLAGCGDGGDAAARRAPDGTFPIADVTLGLIGASCLTAAHGTAPGSDVRALHTTIHYPDAPGRFPLIVLSHGLGALGRLSRSRLHLETDLAASDGRAGAASPPTFGSQPRPDLR
jgi:hypothetical protein